MIAPKNSSPAQAPAHAGVLADPISAPPSAANSAARADAKTAATPASGKDDANAKIPAPLGPQRNSPVKAVAPAGVSPVPTPALLPAASDAHSAASDAIRVDVKTATPASGNGDVDAKVPGPGALERKHHSPAKPVAHAGASTGALLKLPPSKAASVDAKTVTPASGEGDVNTKTAHGKSPVNMEVPGHKVSRDGGSDHSVRPAPACAAGTRGNSRHDVAATDNSGDFVGASLVTRPTKPQLPQGEGWRNGRGGLAFRNAGDLIPGLQHCDGITDGDHVFQFGTCLEVPEHGHAHVCILLHQLATPSTGRSKRVSEIYFYSKDTGVLGPRKTFRAATKFLCDPCEEMKSVGAKQRFVALVEDLVKAELKNITDKAGAAAAKAKAAAAKLRSRNKQNKPQHNAVTLDPTPPPNKALVEVWNKTGLSVDGLKQMAEQNQVHLPSRAAKQSIIRALINANVPPPPRGDSSERDSDASDSDNGGKRNSSVNSRNKRRRGSGGKGGEKKKIAKLERELQAVRHKLELATSKPPARSSETVSGANPSASLVDVLGLLSKQLANPGGQTLIPQPQNCTTAPAAGSSNQLVAYPTPQPMMPACFYPPVGYQQQQQCFSSPYGGFFPTVIGNRVTAPAPQAFNLNLYVNGKPAPESDQ